jgi:hypothetical protein
VTEDQEGGDSGDSDGKERAGSRRRRVKIELPELDTLAGVDQAECRVILAAANGKLAPRVALDFSTMLDRRRRTLTDRDFELRLEAIEQARLVREKAAEQGD